MKCTTYYLGAGASAEALPVVYNMNERMEFFIHRLRSSDVWNELGADFRGVASEFQKIFEGAKKHASIDTYAKKLYLRKEQQNLWILKQLLSCYFIFEQSADDLSDFWFPPRPHKTIENELYKEIIGNIKTNSDQRYDVFLATLLDENLELDRRIRIVSWNYDYQIEQSYQDFNELGISEIRDKLMIYPRNECPAEENARIIKVNGTASIYLKADTLHHFSSHSSSDILKKALDHAKEGINDKESNENIPLINFAWERGAIQERSLKFARQIMRSTSHLIIIGYTFPNFNRTIDKQIFENHTIEKVYFQSKDQNLDALRERALAIIGGKLKITDIIPIKDINQFFIPYEL